MSFRKEVIVECKERNQGYTLVYDNKTLNKNDFDEWTRSRFNFGSSEQFHLLCPDGKGS